MSCWLHMSRSVKGASGHTHGGEIQPVFDALLTSTLMRDCVLACLRSCVLACLPVFARASQQLSSRRASRVPGH